MTQCMKYRALMVVMLAYVLPWIGLKETYKYIFIYLWRTEAVTAAKGWVSIADIRTEEVAYQTEGYRLWMLMLAIWFAFAILILIIRITRYLVRINSLRALAIECEDKNLEETMTRLRESVRYRYKPDIAWTRADNETFAIGIIKPVIFLQKKYADKELYWILKHEIIHVIRKDLWIKLFMEFICCLHWFNPFIYFLERKVRFLCETSCDERVIKGCTDEECRIYIELLDKNKGGIRSRIPFSSALDNGNEEIEKRIALMKEQRNIQRKEKAIAICVFGLLVFLDSLTALAYPQVYHIKSSAIEVAEDSIGGGNFWVDDYVEEGYSMTSDLISYEEQFVDKEGQIFPVELNNKYGECYEHDKVSGIIQIHIVENDGGCIVETYEGTRCTKCSVGWRGELLNKISNMPCTH